MTSTLTGTGDYLIDTLKEHLAKVRGISKVYTTQQRKENADRLFGDRKYYNQAFVLLIIGAQKPSLEFIINLSDLTPELYRELSDLDKTALDFVLKQAVGAIFEDINSWLYHTSVSKVLKVSFAP